MEFKPPDSSLYTLDHTVIHQETNYTSGNDSKLSKLSRSTPTVYGYYNIQTSSPSQFADDLYRQLHRLVATTLGSAATQSISDAELVYYYCDVHNVLRGALCIISDDKLGKIMHVRGHDKISSIGVRPRGVYIYNFCVDTHCQGRGIGTHLLQALLYQIHQDRVLRCQISACNQDSLSIFKKHGFIEEDRITDTRGQSQVNLVCLRS